jgi:hypothetical protein
MVAATVFFGVCSMVIQISFLIAGIPLDAFGFIPKMHFKYLEWFSSIRTLIVLTLAFYLSRKTLGVFDRFLDQRRSKASKDVRIQ